MIYARIALIFVGVLAAALFNGRAAEALDEIVGRARAVTGDTLKIKSIDDGKTRRVRLFGVNAPDPHQHCETKNGVPVDCGLMSLDALDAMMRRKQITCVDLEKDAEGKLAGTCYAGDTVLNSSLVRAGWALAYVEESRDLAGLEERARAEGKGIWPYRFEKPWIWRAALKKAKKAN
jgi:endonuclease YncB( thermonuclease family)